MLLNAILSFSASHLSRLDPTFDPLATIEYHDACVHHLLPALQDPLLATEGALPLCTVILRNSEMLWSETDFQRHLRGCHSLFRYNRNNFKPRSLKHVAFWTYVRQEILAALPKSTTTNIDTSNRTYHVVWRQDTDDEWTNQIIWLSAKIINHCFGEEVTNCSRWEELQRDVNAWKERIPDTFRPISVIHDDEPFPIISYLCTWHIIGMQFYHIAKVLLALYNRKQQSGISLLHFARSIEAEIADQTYQLCGMIRALTLGPKSKHPGVLVNATEPLIICGRSLKRREEQMALIKMLRQIERDTTWPTEQGIKVLEQEWEAQMQRQ